MSIPTRASSRSTWYPQLLPQSRASRGEKLNTSPQDTSLFGFLAGEPPTPVQVCHSNPLIGQLPSTSTTTAGHSSSSVPPSTFAYITPKLEMEEFKDLTAYLTSAVASCKNEGSSVDELNTPVFERGGPFEFNQQYLYADNQSDAVHSTEDPFDFRIKVEEFDFGCLCANNNNVFDNDVIVKCDTPHMDNYLVNQTVQDTLSPKAETNSFKQTPNNFNRKTMDYSTAITDIIFDNSKCDNYVLMQDKIMEDSSNSSGSDAGRQYPKLKLNITGKIIENASTLSTPEVIQTIADIENENFNILDIVSEKEFVTVTTDDLILDLDAVPSPPLHRPPRKRKLREDSDEDYEPPTRAGRKSIKLHSKPDLDSDFSSDEEEVNSRSRRGRPAKRNASISSDSSKDCDAARYRELRDKNNEASRRSRLKRKMKEMELEKEAGELEERNIKLKTQVEELEKTVSNFRNNLFKIMLNK